MTHLAGRVSGPAAEGPIKTALVGEAEILRHVAQRQIRVPHTTQGQTDAGLLEQTREARALGQQGSLQRLGAAIQQARDLLPGRPARRHQPLQQSSYIRGRDGPH